MSMINVEDLTFAYPSSYEPIFEHVSFCIDTDWKLGFIGRNGRGKTTFLNLLLGKYEYAGKISTSVKFDYFPYPVSEPKRMTREVLEEICPLAEEWEIFRELSRLAVKEDVLYRPFETLSKGEQTKALLSALFLKEGNFLLIDEPTNHLDMEARNRVSDYLKQKKGFLLVSHDRQFLDGCIDHVLSLNRTDIEVQAGIFSSWMENFQRQQEFELARNEHLKKDIRRLKESARRSAVWSDQVEATKAGAYDKGYIGHKAAKMMKRSKSIEDRQMRAVEEKEGLLKNLETVGELKLFPQTCRFDPLVSFSKVSIFYGKKQALRPISFSVQKGERVALDGKNGSGKTSLLKLLLGEEISCTGEAFVASGLVISYVSQDTSSLCGSLSDFAGKHRIDETLFKAVLRKMDFGRVQFEKDVRDFSEGQKKKTLLAKSICEQAHLYVWDEPLNFIDVYSRMQIEELILKYSPTMIFVEHDKAFRDAVATKTVQL